jgi:hypothetical protein
LSAIVTMAAPMGSQAKRVSEECCGTFGELDTNPRRPPSPQEVALCPN